MTPKTDIKTTGGAGYIPPIPMNLNPYAGSLKDIAYRIMSQSSHQSRTLRDVMEATLQSIASSPYPEDRYTGSFATYTEEQELLELTRENNQLLKLILRYVLHDEGNDFITNVIANLLSNRIDGYGQRYNSILRAI